MTGWAATAITPCRLQTLIAWRIGVCVWDQWIRKTGDKGQSGESDDLLMGALKQWGEQAVNPEYHSVRNQTE